MLEKIQCQILMNLEEREYTQCVLHTAHSLNFVF